MTDNKALIATALFTADYAAKVQEPARVDPAFLRSIANALEVADAIREQTLREAAAIARARDLSIMSSTVVDIEALSRARRTE